LQKIWNILRHWLPLAAMTTGLCALVYLVGQQVLRQTANDPQIQMAQDTAYALSQGVTPHSVLPSAQVDISRSLAPFLILYNDAGEMIGSSASLHEGTPSLPIGIFAYVRQHGEDRVTWQPEPGVRIAAVIDRYEGANAGFVLAGRSLLEVEKREDNIQSISILAMVVIWAVTLAVVAFCELVFPRYSG